MKVFKLLEKDGMTTVELLHIDVPEKEVKYFADGWKDYYIGPLKKTSGKQIMYL